MKPMLIAGIDPGANGAICVLSSTGSAPQVPLFDLKNKTPWEIDSWLFTYQPSFIWIEDVHSLYGMSAKSNFSFGRNIGMLHGMCEVFCSGCPPETVTPKVWQKFAGVTVKGKAIKKQVAKIANTLYPAADLYGKRGGLLDGRADALMIAHYALHHQICKTYDMECNVTSTYKFLSKEE